MALYYITGPTGSGKSTIAEQLRQQGYDVYDSDDAGMRSWYNNQSWQLVAEPTNDQKNDQAWLADHVYTLSFEKVTELKDRAKDKIFFVCGTSAADMELKEDFTRIFLLVIDEDTQKHRIEQRTNSDYGKQPHQLAAALKWRDPQIRKYLESGAIQIDATGGIDQVLSTILESIQNK